MQKKKDFKRRPKPELPKRCFTSQADETREGGNSTRQDNGDA